MEKDSRRIFVQRQLKDGSWSKPFPVIRLGVDAPEKSVERLAALNPGRNYRLFAAEAK